MAQRRYGPTRGAGTALIEQEGDKQIEASALGWKGYSGITEKGPTDELIIAPKKTDYNKICGGYVDDSYLPNCAFDYYKVANGAGGLAIQRVTDGTEVQAQVTLYARKTTGYETNSVPMGTLKAHNGGRWGGKYLRGVGAFTGAGDVAATVLSNVGTDWKKNSLVGGRLQITGIANSNYLIVANDPDAGGGTITVTSDSTMDTDFSGSDYEFFVLLENDGKAVSFVIEDGENNPDSEFALSVYVDGNFLKKYPNLHTDPTSSRYWVNIINNDTGNYAIEAENLWTGAHTADVRPANEWGQIASVAETVLTKKTEELKHTVGDLDPTLTMAALTEFMLPQIITLTWSDATTAAAVSDRFGALGSVTIDALFASPNKWTPGFTIVAGGTAPEAGDTSVIYFNPLIPDSLIGGFLYPDKPNAKLEKYRIVDNTVSTITVAAGSDLTASGATDDYYMVEYPQELLGGMDGNEGVVDATYIGGPWDVTNSMFNRLIDKGYGLVKMATPGITSTAVQQAGAAYAEAKNHQYRYEIPVGVTTESSAMEYVNDTLGRNDFVVVAFPSYYSGIDPNDTGEGKWKTIPTTGLIHGREARIVANYDGYHKAQAGVDAKLPGVLAIPTGEAILNEELLNPQGIQVIKKKQGNYVIWGDRAPSVDPTWKWKHQREQLSYYEHVLQKSFDWINFMINDSITQPLALVALESFFRPEWRPKRALRGAEFEDAAKIKLDNEINTDATRADGDMFSEISLRLADTIERFIIKIGKQGIFESVA